jgi:hypothetical protein
VIKFYADKLFRNLDDYGIKHTIKKSVFAVLGLVFIKRKYRIYRKDLGNLFDECSTSFGEFQCKEIKSVDEKAIIEIEKIAEWMKGCLEKMLKEGAYCLAIMEDEKVIAFNLINFNNVWIPLVNYYKKFNPISAWSEHIWVVKKYRKSGMATYLRKRIFCEMAKKGIRWLYGGSLLDNKASLRVAEKLDFKCIIDIDYLKIFGCKKWRFIRI